MDLTYLAAILGCAILISGQNQPLKCDQYRTVTNFFVNQYTGLWYELERIPSAYDMVGECATAQYRIVDNGHLQVKNTMCLYNNTISITGDVMEQEKGSMKHGKFSVSFPVMGSARSPYWVLATNYTDFSIVLSCTEKENGQSVYGWILSRRPTLTKYQNRKINEILAHNNLMREDFKSTKHDNCCYRAREDGNSAASTGCSLVLLISSILIRFF